MEYTQEMKDLITKFRAEWKKHDDERDEGLSTEIPEVIRHNDISYGPYGCLIWICQKIIQANCQ